MRSFRLIAIILIFFGTLFSDTSQGNYHLVNKKEKRKSHLVFFVDETNGKKFLLKQTNGFSSKERFDIVHEALGAHLADALGIPTQKIAIVPAGKFHPLKTDQNRAASIHTIVPGKQIRKSAYSHIDIKQYTSSVYPKEMHGLSERVIQDMAKDPQLPPIVALDTFIGMNDRSGSNLMVDEKTGTYWVIDMADAFEKNLPRIAHEKLQKEAGFDCDALKSYQKHLQFLINRFPPEKMHALLDSFIEQTAESFSKKAIADKKNRIRESYEDAKKLMRLLDRLTAQPAALDKSERGRDERAPFNHLYPS